MTNTPIYITGKCISDKRVKLLKKERALTVLIIKRVGGFTYEWTPERRKVMSDRMLVTSEKWKKRVKCVEDNLSFNSLTDAAKHYGVNVSTLCGHLKGYQHTCKGKHFIYS